MLVIICATVVPTVLILSATIYWFCCMNRPSAGYSPVDTEPAPPSFLSCVADCTQDDVSKYWKIKNTVQVENSHPCTSFCLAQITNENMKLYAGMHETADSTALATFSIHNSPTHAIKLVEWYDILYSGLIFSQFLRQIRFKNCKNVIQMD